MARTIDFPAIAPDGESWTIRYNTQSFESDLNGAIQTAELPGARWSVSLTFTNRQGKTARALQGFLTAIRGRAGRFWVTPTDWELQGAATQNGIVGGGASLTLDFAGEVYEQFDWDAYSAPAGSNSMQASGFGSGGLPPLLAGDWFEINGELKKCTADMEGDTLEFAPPLRIGVSYGQTVRVIRPRCRMMLSSDSGAGWQTTAPVIYGITLDAIEALDI